MRFAVCVLGAVGLLICLTGVVGVWIVRAPVEQAQQQAFAQVDESLERINRRLMRVQQLAADARFSLEDVRSQLAAALEVEAAERVAEQFELANRVDRLAALMREGQTLLDSSDDVAQYIEQTLHVASRLGASADPNAIEPLREQLAVLALELNDAAATLESAGEQLAGEPQQQANANGRRQLARKIAQLLATFGNLDARFASAHERVENSRLIIRALGSRLSRQMLTAAVVATVLLLWMAAGQASLWRNARLHDFQE